MRNRYIRSYVCIAFVLVSALSLLAQSDRNEVQQRDDLQQQVADGSQARLTRWLISVNPNCLTHPVPQKLTRRPQRQHQPRRQPLPRLSRAGFAGRHRLGWVAHSRPIAALRTVTI